MFHRYLFALNMILLLLGAVYATGWDRSSLPNSGNDQKIIVDSPPQQASPSFYSSWSIFLYDENNVLFANQQKVGLTNNTEILLLVSDNSIYVVEARAQAGPSLISTRNTIRVGDRTPPRVDFFFFQRA